MSDRRPEPARRTDVVFALSTETWNDLVRREFARPPDRIVQHLRTSDQVSNLLVVNPWRGLASQLRRRLGSTRDASFPATPHQHLLRPVRLRRADSAEPAALERSYRAYTRLVHLALHARGIRRPVLITVNPFVAAFGATDGFASVTYFARDDWSAYPPLRHMQQAYELAYERLRERRTRVAAVSRVLLDRIAPSGASAVVPNGVDPATWSEPGRPPAPAAALPRPLTVYTGTIDDRLSVPMLEAAARAVTGGTVLLVGPADERALQGIKAAVPGVVHMKSLRQSELAAVVRSSDVCLVPHVRSALTEAMSPLKIYEYLAAGKPVAATDLAPMRDIHQHVVLAADAHGFEEAITTALRVGDMDEATRSRFIAQHSWRSRCEQVLELAL